MKVQQQEVIQAFQKGLAVPEEKARKLAIVVDAAMARGQANRAINSADTRYFTDVEAAEAWLFADESGGARRLTPVEARRALLQEGDHALLEILGAAGLALGDPLGGERFGEAEMGRIPRELADQRVGGGRARRRGGRRAPSPRAAAPRPRRRG